MKLICERYVGNSVGIQKIIDALNAVEDVPGVTQLVDVITEYRRPSYGFAGSIHDVPVYTNVFITTLPDAKSPTAMVTNETPVAIIEFILKQILYSLIHLRNRGVVYLPLDWENVVVDGTTCQTLIYGVTGAEFGTDPSRLPLLFARFITNLFRESNMNEMSPYVAHLVQSARTASSLEEMIPNY